MEFPADITSLPSIMSSVRESLEKESLKAQDIYKIELATEEAVVNVISYAYPEKKGNEVLSIECKMLGSKAFEMTLIDCGIAFNPIESIIDPGVEKPIEERKIGGLGVFLLRKLADELSYKRVDGKNILKLLFKLS